MTLSFFLPMIPPTVTAQQHRIGGQARNGKRIIYDGDRLADARAKLTAYLARHAPQEPIAGSPVRLVVKWCFPRGCHKAGTYKTTRPDTDNLQKLLKDCMTVCGYWTDDALVSSEIAEKFWAEVPGIYVAVQTIEEDAAHGEKA